MPAGRDFAGSWRSAELHDDGRSLWPDRRRKDAIASVLVCCIVVIFVSMAYLVYAAPGDISITITMPRAKALDYLVARPIPQIFNPAYDPNDPNSPALINEYTPKVWLKMQIIDDIRKVCKQGRQIRAIEAIVVDPNEIQ